MNSSIVPQGAIAPGTLTKPKAKQLTHAHLQFWLGPQTLAALPTRCIQEAMTVATQRITPMPNMPPCMLGLINRRSRVLWIADLATLLGLPIAYPRTQQYNLILLQVDTLLVGLRVYEIEGILSITPDQIQPPPANIPSSLVPFLRGCVVQSPDIILTLDAEAIAAAQALQPA
jgi:positive phototaxis protein PixI